MHVTAGMSIVYYVHRISLEVTWLVTKHHVLSVTMFEQRSVLVLW